MEIKKCLGAKIRHLRKEKKYSQEYFAELIDLNPRQIVRIECGENMPSIENLEKIAKVFDIPVEELFINSCYMNEEFLREKICAKAQIVSGDTLKALYLMAVNL